MSARGAGSPHFGVMDNLNQALADLSDTVQALHAVDTHIDGSEDNETCRVALSRLLMADLGLLKAAERQAWRVVVAPKGVHSEAPQPQARGEGHDQGEGPQGGPAPRPPPLRAAATI
jgi:hypothetical protein